MFASMKQDVPVSLRRAMAVVGLTLAVAAGLSLQPAQAQEWPPDGGPGWHHYDHDHWRHERMERERWEWEHRYGEPMVVVAPPPRAIYAPPPVVMAPPAGLSIVVPLNIR